MVSELQCGQPRPSLARFERRFVDSQAGGGVPRMVKRQRGEHGSQAACEFRGARAQVFRTVRAGAAWNLEEYTVLRQQTTKDLARIK